MAVIRFLVIACWTMLVVLCRRLIRGRRHPLWSYGHEVAAEIARNELRNGARLLETGRRIPEVDVRAHPLLTRRVRYERLAISGVPALVVTPKAHHERDATLLYAHGGGYVGCSTRTYQELVTRVAIAANARVVAVDYRLAPEHPFPAAIDDCEAVYRALASEAPGERLFVAGDSAGGGLTLALLQRLRDAGAPMPRAAILISPWVDLTCASQSIRRNALYDYLPSEALSYAAKQYLGSVESRHPQASAIYADLRGLPPLLVHIGGAELFLDEGRAFVERARAAGVEVTDYVSEGMIHVWHLFAALFPESRRAIAEIGAYVQSRLPQAQETRAESVEISGLPVSPSG